MLNHKKYLTVMVLMAMYSNSYAGRFEMIQSAVKQPSLESCSPYRDVLGQEFQYSQNDISGPIPYTRSYKTGLSENLNRSNEITDGLRTIGGWQDNFNHYLIAYDEGPTKSGDLRILLRLRDLGENDETAYVGGLGADKKLSKISRIFSSMPLVYEAYLRATGNGRNIDGDQVGEHNTEHRDKGLVLNGTSKVFSDGQSVENVKGLSFTLYRDGNKYTLTNIFSTGSDAVYKITTAELATGQILKFKYDTTGGLLKIVDQYGNFLVFERNQKDPDTYYAAFNYPTKVQAGKFSTKSTSIDEYLNRQPTEAELASEKVQTASYSYQEFDWRNFINDRQEKVYAVSRVQSTNNGQDYYEYTKTGNINAVRKIVGSGLEDPAYQMPSLAKVYKQEYRETGSPIQTTIAAFDYKRAASPLWFHEPFSSLQNGLKRASALKTGGTEVQYKNFTSNRRINFISKDGVADKEVDPVYIQIRGDHRSRDLYIDFSGNPCITYNNIPIKQAGFDVNFSALNYVIDKNGNTTAFGYDNFGRLTSVVEAQGDTILKRTTNYTYSPDSRRFQTPTKVEKKDEVIDNILDDKGRVVDATVTNTNGAVTKTKKYTNVYANDLLKTQTDADGTVKTIEYEDIGVNKKKETITKDSLSAVTEYSNYNSAGEARRIVEPTGVVKTTTFDFNNRPKAIEKRDPVSNANFVTSYSYDEFRNQLIEERSPDGNIKKYQYDKDNGLLQSIVFADKFLKTKYTYNSNGRILTEKEQFFAPTGAVGLDNEGPLKDIVTNIYDRADRIIEQKYGTNSAANWQQTEYDLNGNVLKVTKPSVDATNSVESFTYDTLNRMKTYTDPLGKVYNYDYDSFDNATLKKASNGSNSLNIFESGKDLAKETNSDFGIKEYTYDKNSNLLTSKFASTRYCNYLSYDVLDKYKQLNCSYLTGSPSIYNVNYQFNYHSSRFGRLDKVESLNKTGFVDTRYKGGNTVYGYNGLDRVISKEQRVGRLQNTDNKLVVNYTYTTGDRIKEITYPSGKKISYLYDYFTMYDPWTGGETIYGDPRLASVSVGDQKILGLGYNDLSLVSSLKWGNGNTTDYLYDSVKNITNITNKVANTDYDSIVNTYYNNGLLQTKKIGTQTNTYMYDKKGQLLQEIVSGAYTHTFSYDDNGNRKSFTSSGVNNPYPISSAAYTYVTSCNKYATMTHNSVAQSFSYNATGELNLPNLLGTAVYDYQGRRASEGATPDGKFTAHEIEYNHNNQRILTARNGINRQYIYDEADHLLGEYDANGVAIVEYVWMGDKPVAALYPNSTVYLLTDEKNTPYRGIDAANNAKVWVRNADAFGVAKPTTETVEMNLRFPGQIYDKATGLHYNLNRYYNPLLGRYMEADPIGLEGGWNPYAYAGNDPVNNTDASGLIIDTVADVGFIAYDLYKIARTGATATNLAALGADIAGAAIPGMTGLGTGVRASAKVKNLGGSYDTVKGVVGNEAHHMPANSVSPLSTGRGPSITMTKADHKKTASHGSSTEAKAYRAEQKKLIEQGKFREAQQKDIDDIQSKFGTKYDNNMYQMKLYTYKIMDNPKLFPKQK